MVEFGGGIFAFAPFKLAVFESFLPRGTSHAGPPLCFKKRKKKVQSNESYSLEKNNELVFYILH
jgi:hypothetical protein